MKINFLVKAFSISALKRLGYFYKKIKLIHELIKLVTGDL